MQKKSKITNPKTSLNLPYSWQLDIWISPSIAENKYVIQKLTIETQILPPRTIYF